MTYFNSKAKYIKNSGKSNKGHIQIKTLGIMVFALFFKSFFFFDTLDNKYTQKFDEITQRTHTAKNSWNLLLEL